MKERADYVRSLAYRNDALISNRDEIARRSPFVYNITLINSNIILNGIHRRSLKDKNEKGEEFCANSPIRVI